MERSEIKSKKEELKEIISKTSKELEELQKLCKHPETTITMYEEKGHSTMRKVCVDCGTATGYVNDNDIKEELTKGK